MGTWAGRAVVVWSFLSLSLACGRVTPSAQTPEPTVLRAWQPLAMEPGAVPKRLGEDCLRNGRAGCIDGACVRVGMPGEATERVCSKSCESEDDCPLEWGCVRMLPFEAAGICAPPRGFQKGVVTRVRPPRAPRPAPPTPFAPPVTLSAAVDGGTR